MREALIVAAFVVGGCSSEAWKTTGTVLDVLAGPTPREECEAGGGKWTEESTYDSKTGKLLHVEQKCVKEMK